MASRAAALVLLALLGCAAFAHAQEPVCKTYKKLLTVSEPKILMDTITVPDSAPVQSVSVSSMSVAYPKIGDLQVTLLQGVPGSPTPATFAVLKSGRAGAEGANLANTAFSDAATAEFPAADAAPFTGTFKPAQPLSGFAGKDAAGSWVLRIADVSTDNPTPSPITLTGWSIEVCFAGTPVPAPATAQGPSLSVSTPGATVSLGSEGRNVTVPPQNGTANVTSFSGPMDMFKSTKFGKTVSELLMPFKLPEADKNAGFNGPISQAKDMVHDAMVNEVTDVATLIEAKSTAIKNYLNKKVGDYINTVNGASTATQGIIKGGTSQIGTHMKNMMAQLVAFKSGIGKGSVKNLVNAELGKQVDHVMAVGGQFMTVFSALAGDMGSTGTLMKDAVTAKAKAIVDTYTTAEGVVAAHIEDAVQKRVDKLNNMLDQIMAMAVAAQGATGPVLDMKLELVQYKLKLLEAALDKLAAVVKAMPKPSELVSGKMALIGSMLEMHPMGRMILDPEVFLAQFNSKIFKFKDWMAKTFGCTGVNCTPKP